MKIGFIGCGNMAGAMIGGLIGGGKVAKENVMASDVSKENLEQMQQRLGIGVTTDNTEVAKASDILVLSVKPQYYPQVIEQIKDLVKDTAIVVTIAPGITLEMLENSFGRQLKIIRTMPNTPVLVGEGMIGMCPGKTVTKEEQNLICDLFSVFSKVEIVPENLMDVVVSVSGSSPAYVFMFIEAMADAAVADGMPRNQAYEFAAQAVYGSAKMVLETGKHPGQLKDMVCSPAGTTIEAVRVLEEKGFRSSVFEAMKACTEKSRSFSKK